MTLTTFWVNSRGFTCFNFQHKHKHLVDPKQTVGIVREAPSAQTAQIKYVPAQMAEGRQILDFNHRRVAPFLFLFLVSSSALRVTARALPHRPCKGLGHRQGPAIFRWQGLS